ncbi:acid phosphatase-domain-containing protein [Crepidotus variabilis]|uniref:Acid phosphatase-domain-containing protein n=1 Tax=Crepidotus variabilis TaxID=179855 RepID=A0A9P6EI37_9AGAR|nr:acid phosphatase-domain-containing protein [Crepidotus variabilis]
MAWYPKVVGLDTDWTIWQNYLGMEYWGKGPGAASTSQDNIERVDRWTLRDKTNKNMWIKQYNDIANIVYDILKNGAKLAIVSRNRNKEMCDRALTFFNANNPNDGNKEYSIIHLVTYDEIIDQSKVEHWRRIHGWSGEDYSEFLMFDDEAAHNSVRIEVGVTFQQARDKKGLYWDLYIEGLNAWRRAKTVIMHNTPTAPKNRKLIGYSGLPGFWIDLIGKGEGIVEPKTPYRWGYAFYIADYIELAKYFCGWNGTWINDDGSKVCEVWVRDYEAWQSINKVWVPENGGGLIQMNNIHWSYEETGQNQEDRDRIIAGFGVPTPYVLFSRHHWMNGMPVPQPQRWSEMVVYTQVQRALFDVVPLTDAQVKANTNPRPYPFHHQIKEWNITVPSVTWQEFKSRGETDYY